MPDISNGLILAGFPLGFLIWVMVRRIWGRRLFVPLALALGVGAAYVLPFVQPTIRLLWDTAGLAPLTGGAVFIGLLCGTLALSFASHGRSNLWGPSALSIAIGFGAAYGVPPLMDRVTGSYQAASLRADVNACTDGMRGQVQPRDITNTCDTAIVVGLCMPGEVNPTPCAQTALIAPGDTATFDPGEARLSSVPGNPSGLTVVACRPPDRPSRWGNVTGRGYRGVCLPPG